MFDTETQLPPTDFERQTALDKALSSFSTPTVIQGVSAKTIQAIPGAGYTDNPEVVDDEELEQAEGEQVEEEVEDESDTTEDSEGLSPGFAEDFKKTFGLEPQEAIQTFNELLNFRNEVLLMQEWNVTPGEYRSRMSEVREFYEGLPEEGRAQFNTPEGAMAIYNHLHPNGENKRTSAVKTTRKTSKVASKPKHLFTKEQIIRMSPDEFRANAAAIQQAYLKGQVKE